MSETPRLRRRCLKAQGGVVVLDREGNPLRYGKPDVLNPLVCGCAQRRADPCMIDWVYSLAGALTGFVVGLTGVGCGALMTPILLLVFGVSPVTAIATDLWFAAITKLVGARVHHASGQVDWQVAKRLWLGSLPLALLVIVPLSLGAQVAKVEWLSKAIGVVVLITAVGLLAAPKLIAYARNRRLSQAERLKAMQSVLTVVLGAVLLGSLLAGKITGRWVQIGLALVLMVAGVKVLA